MLKQLSLKLGSYSGLKQVSDFTSRLCSSSSKTSVPLRPEGIYSSKFVCVCKSDSKLISSMSMAEKEVPEELNMLKGLDRVHINQTRIIGENSNVFIGSGLSLIEMEVRNRKNLKMFNIEFQRGDFPEEFFIKIYSGDDNALLAFMYLEPSIQFKTVILRITAPPGNVISSIYEVKGISNVAIVEDEKCETVFQLLTNGGFGWTTSAKILTPTGDKTLGQMYRMKSQPLRNSLCVTIHFPCALETSSKVSLIGAGLILVKDQ